jgi:hypothetical protein
MITTVTNTLPWWAWFGFGFALGQVTLALLLGFGRTGKGH